VLARWAAALVAVVVWLAPAPSAAARFMVTDERAGVTFDAIVHQTFPYQCGAPCTLLFTPVSVCNTTMTYSWELFDATGAQRFTITGTGAWRRELTELGAFRLFQMEHALNCGSGATFQLQVVDRSPPETTITAAPHTRTREFMPSFGFTASEPGSRFECRLGGSPYAPCDSPFTASPLGDGRYAFSVRGIDNAGNVDPTPASTAFRLRGPAVVARWRRDRRGTRVARLRLTHVADAPPIAVHCVGRGCPFSVRRPSAQGNVLDVTRAFGDAALRPGTRITVIFGSPEEGQRVYRFTVRARPLRPRFERLCRTPGAAFPSACSRP
jgi:hypothetical protein